MALETPWFTDVYLPDNRQLYEVMLGWGKDGKTGIGDYSAHMNGEWPVGKVSGCYLMGEAQRSKTNMLLSRRVTICTHPLSPPAQSGFGSSPSPSIPC